MATCNYCGGQVSTWAQKHDMQDCAEHLLSENARLAAAHEAAADELARVMQELREAVYLLAKIDADMGMDDDGDLFCYFDDSNFVRKIEDMAQKYKPAD